MNSCYYLNDDHTTRPCTIEEWIDQIKTLSKEDRKHVGIDRMEGKLISTVWLGINHAIIGEEPMIFETMVFVDDGHMQDIYCRRYSNWDDALKGHNKAVTWVLKGCNSCISA